MGVFSIMSDKIKTGLSDMKVGISNIVKKPLRKAKLEFHYRKAGERRLVIYKKYEPMIKYLKGINDQLMEIEARFGKIEDELMPQVEELYRFCGPYTDPKLIEFEQKYASSGTMYNKDLKEEEKDFDVKKININGEEFSFDMPPAKPVYFEQDNRTEMVVYFGYDKVVKFWNDKFCKFIDEVCNKAENKIEREVKNPTEKENELKYIDVVRKIYKTKIGYLFRERASSEEGRQSIGGYEFHFSIKYLRVIYDRIISDYDSLMSSILKIVPQKIKYKHTYKIAVPVLRGHDGKEKDRLERYGINPPVDERGMPWEVDDNGEIMIGPNKGKPVPKEFIKQESLIKIAPWVVNEFDSYRDDLRDGRYHPESLTVADYIMANNYSAGGEWKKGDETKLKTDKLNRDNDDRKYTMRLHDGRVIEGIRRPDNLNPAFDLRAFEPEENGVIGIHKRGKEWIHIGRKYYYADCEEIAKDEQDDPVATTRGTAMYLIDKFHNEGMLMEEIREDIRHIGEFAGWDYGPRAFGAAFVAPLCTDPWNIDLSSANISSKPYKKG